MGAPFEPRLAVNLWIRPEGQGHGKEIHIQIKRNQDRGTAWDTGTADCVKTPGYTVINP